MAAVENEHADCVDCHESGPVSAGAARLRMAVAYLCRGRDDVFAGAGRPPRCLRCHGDIERETLEAPAGLRVSHKEILTSGRACSDCHRGVGHTAGRSFAGGMASCTVCHDGETAAGTCETCHAGGSPLEGRPDRGLVCSFVPVLACSGCEPRLFAVSRRRPEVRGLPQRVRVCRIPTSSARAGTRRSQHLTARSAASSATR